MDDLRRQALEKLALEVLTSDGVVSLGVDPIAIAQKRDIFVQAKAASAKGVSGMLVQHGNAFAISYATHIPSLGFQRFSISHELGHYFIPGHPDAVFSNGPVHESRAGFITGDPIELEADHFAACLLMPRAPFMRAMDRRKDGLDAVTALAEACETSLTATAIRYAELTTSRVAVIVSSGRQMDYCMLSRPLKQIRGIRWPKKGHALPKDSATLALRARDGAVDRSEGDAADSDTSIWFDSDREIALQEEVVGLGGYGRTLTVLTIDEPEDDEEDEDNDRGRARDRNLRW